MKEVRAVFFGVMLVFGLMGSVAFAQQDSKGCKDHDNWHRWRPTRRKTDGPRTEG